MVRQISQRRPPDRPVMVTLFDGTGDVLVVRYFASQVEALLRMPKLAEDYPAAEAAHVAKIKVSLFFGRDA